MTILDKADEIVKARTKGHYICDDSRPHELMVYPDLSELGQKHWACDYPATDVDCLPDATFYTLMANCADEMMKVIRAAKTHRHFQSHDRFCNICEAYKALEAKLEETLK